MYCGCGHDHDLITLADSDLPEEIPEDLTTILNRMVQGIYDAKAMPDRLDKDVVGYYADTLWTAVQEGYGKTIDAVDWDSPDFGLLSRLREDVWQFSSAKNYQQLKALSQALLDDDGKLRTFSQFRQEAGKINGQQYSFLRTEYNTAVGSAQMASKWQEMAKDKERFPLLQFDAIMDGHTSALCRSLDGVIKPVDDPFWEKYFPPNHYNCRSNVRQLRRGEITPDDKIIYPEKMHEAWKVNLGKQKLVFPPGHPYYDGLPESVMVEAANMYKKELKKEAKQAFGSTSYNVSDIGQVTITNSKIDHLGAFTAANPQQLKQYSLIGIANKLLENAQLIDYTETNESDALGYYKCSIKGLTGWFIKIVKTKNRDKKSGDFINTLYEIVNQ